MIHDTAKPSIRLQTVFVKPNRGGVGQGNQNDLTLHFGLGQHKEKVKYEVTWTNGAKQEGETGIDRMIRVEMKTGK